MLDFLKNKTSEETNAQKICRLRQTFAEADAIIIGAGAGLSTAAGFTYNGPRFQHYFHDFEKKYGFHDMYSGGFHPYETPEEHWAYWSRYIFVNRFMDPPKPVYEQLYKLVKAKDYFVLTTNVDHCFQKAGFDKKRLFYTQGDYGLFQCSVPCHDQTYDNEAIILQMLEAQGFLPAEGMLSLPEGGRSAIRDRIPSSLVPHCPKCGRPMTMNLRSDNTFVEDEGWHLAAERYSLFLQRHRNMKILFLELGVGYNTPVIIKYPFWQMTAKNKGAVYACLNFDEAAAPGEIAAQSICINCDIAEILENLSHPES